MANVSFIAPHIIKSIDGGFNLEIKFRLKKKPFRANDIAIGGENFAIFVCDSGIFTSTAIQELTLQA